MTPALQPIALATVQFHGDELQAVCLPDNKVYVSLRRCCESLGIDFATQFRKLRDKTRCPWSRIVIWTIRDTTGRQQGVCLIDERTLVMWLGNIHSTKVRPDVRDKLLRYQVECADVLHDHFFNHPPPPTTVQPAYRPWSARLEPTILDHNREIVVRHGGGFWSAVTGIGVTVFALEDELLRHCLPLDIKDLPDGSVGARWRMVRAAQPWARPTYRDCPLVMPGRFFRGEPIRVLPYVYSPEELPHFNRWLHEQYLPECLPDYLMNKFPQRQYGLAPASAADRASRQLAGRPAVLSGRTRRKLIAGDSTAGIGLSDGPRQLGLFEE